MLYPRKAAIFYAVRGITLYSSADDFLCEIALSITKVVITILYVLMRYTTLMPKSRRVQARL